jgi:hypothetical protein
MSTQNYCMINEATNVCDNVVLWDGNPDSWTPPAGYLMLVQATTPAKTWGWDTQTMAWVLVDDTGNGQIGFTWDGTYLITNEPQPTEPPTVEGAQTL